MYNYRMSKTLEQLEIEMDHADLLFNQAADAGDMEAMEKIMGYIQDLGHELQALITKG